MLNKLRDIPAQVISKSVFLAKEDHHPEIQVLTCQICKEKNYEALFCKRAAYVYCKESGHISNNCANVDTKIILFCKWCSQQGHTISACRFKWVIVQKLRNI